jgi:hypothetical protein
MIALIGACITMQLVLARAADGQDAPAERVFDDHPGTLAWAAWTIARLGGWTGYESERSTGPITMRDGLQRFNSLVDGYRLAKNVCSS